MTDPTTPAAPESLGAAIDAATSAPGKAESEHGHARAEVAVVDADRLGVVVERVRVSRTGDAPVSGIAERVHAIARDVRPGGDRLVPVEIAPELGGGTLRTAPDRLRGGRFFQIDVDKRGAEVHRYRADPTEGRVAEPFTMTRDELGRLVDDLVETLDEGDE